MPRLRAGLTGHYAEPSVNYVTLRPPSHVAPLASGREAVQVTSSYLDQPLVPLAMALPLMLAEVEAELAVALPAQEQYLRQRAELLHWLMIREGIPYPCPPRA